MLQNRGSEIAGLPVIFANGSKLGKSPSKWLESVRVHQAAFLLEQGELSPEQIADSCGFSSAVAMRRVFIRNFGLSPAAWRKAWSAKN